MCSLQQHQQLTCFLAGQVSGLQQQVEGLQQAAESSQAAHKQVVDQLKQALSDKDLLEQQLQAVMLQGPAGCSLATALTVHLWHCKAVFDRPMSIE
jgi:signal transduction histidine kinase